MKTKSVDVYSYSTLLLTQPLSRLQCEVESVNVELKEFHSHVFIAFSFILQLAPAHFNVGSATCAERSVEPWQVWGVTASAASGTAFSVPEWIISEPTVSMYSSVAVIMLSHKGW